MAGRIVLVGGGHAHLHVVEDLGRASPPGWEIMLVSPETRVVYSGMVPGIIAGHYRRDESEIDLPRLCEAYGVGYRRARAAGIDRRQKRLMLDDGTWLPYDLLSLDVGSVPAVDDIEGARDRALPVKPLGAFLGNLDSAVDAASRHIAIVGGGPAGVEIALALRHRQEATAIVLVSGGDLLESQPSSVRRQVRGILAARNVVLQENAQVIRIAPDHVGIAGYPPIASNLTILATGAAAPSWLTATDLALSSGFVAVHATLQTVTDPDIFAAGDCAEIEGVSRPKAGVFAVRAGPPLAANLRARALGRPLRPWSPQATHLAMLATGPKHAIATRGRLHVSGRFVWWLKDRIDRSWVERFRKP